MDVVNGTCRKRIQPLKKKKPEGSLHPPSRCIADDDAGVFFEPVVASASRYFQVPPPPNDVLLHSLLERRCFCCWCRCSGKGPPKKSACYSLMLWILWIVLVVLLEGGLVGGAVHR